MRPWRISGVTNNELSETRFLTFNFAWLLRRFIHISRSDVDVENVYNVLSVKLDVCKKPIFPVLPSVVNARKEIMTFLDKGNINFPDEVVLGKALPRVFKTPKPIAENIQLPEIDKKAIYIIDPIGIFCVYGVSITGR